MFIRKVCVGNFKSIIDSNELTFDQNFVVLAGKNNTGKTALIESIYRCFQGEYMSLNTSGGSGRPEGIQQSSDVSLRLLLELSEAEKQFIYNELSSTDYWGRYLALRLRAKQGQTRIDYIATFDNPDEEPKCSYTVNQHADTAKMFGRTPAGNVFNSIPNVEHFISTCFGQLSKTFIFVGGNRRITEAQGINEDMKLNTAASNLHTVLHTLHNNREDAFDAIQKAFIDIFEDVVRLHTTVVNSLTNIQVEFQFGGSPIPLQECGTGFTHVLIMLCIIFSESNRIVLFDEPHSFLHPSAEKALYDLALKHPSHQFVFTTHSPILLNYPIEKELYLVTKNEGESIFHKLDNKQEALSEIGISNSDFALSDRVLFVEGSTEEHVIPLLFSKYDLIHVGQTCKIVRLDGTGKEFSKKTAMNNRAQLLKKLFSGVSEITIPYCFLIDRDERTNEKIAELHEAYGESILILDRREIENYMLDSEAIAKVLISNGKEVVPEDIKAKIDVCLSSVTDKLLFPKGCQNPLHDIKGSIVLERVFETYSLEYSKVKDGIAISREILKNQENDLNKVASILGEFLK
ncbi:MAG: ATP-dependent nuclease [Bacillota bacterium]